MFLSCVVGDSKEENGLNFNYNFNALFYYQGYMHCDGGVVWRYNRVIQSANTYTSVMHRARVKCDYDDYYCKKNFVFFS